MDLIEYPDSEIMAMTLARTLAEAIEDTLITQGRATLAVPGGTTPAPVFDSLSAITLPWDRVDVLLTDERWVPESSPRSNTALLRRHLLTGPAQAATLLPLVSDDATPEEGLPALAAGIAPHLPLSVCLLGMGADMHTASLFPGADRLAEALEGDDILYPMRAPGAPEPRVTLSARILKMAMHRHIVITGADKREALEQARTLAPAQAPVAGLLDDSTVHWAP
ncbi:MAG: 6-phosphogluconolactonase [Rhodobacterales bacterium]|nr:MAG: 6-phosphogluconolactonase [Rhodobacterales bacterium]